jgi:hypothetical protein
MSDQPIPSQRLDLVLMKIRRLKRGEALAEAEVDSVLTHLHALRVTVGEIEQLIVPRDRILAVGRTRSSQALGVADVVVPAQALT